MTVPSRKLGLLVQTLESLKKAGFNKPRLFVDGAKSGYEIFGLETTYRYPTIRAHGNWMLALNELYIRDPEASRYAIFQDDFVTYLNLRQYLDSCQYPEKGYWNLYTFPENQKRIPDGKLGWFRSNQLGLGAVALVFSRDAAMVLLSASHMVERVQVLDHGWKAVDGGIVSSMTKAGWAEYVHSPSLVQHTGMDSTLGNKKHPQASYFLGENYDAMGLRNDNVLRTSG